MTLHPLDDTSADPSSRGAHAGGAEDEHLASCGGPWSGHRVLRLLGEDLDAGREPRIFTRGVLWPSAAFTGVSTTAQGNSREVIGSGATKERERPSDPAGASGAAGTDRPAARAREGTAGRLAAGSRGPSGPDAPELGGAAVDGRAERDADSDDEGRVPGDGRDGTSGEEAGGVHAAADGGEGPRAAPATFGTTVSDEPSAWDAWMGGAPPHVRAEFAGVREEYPQLRARHDGEVVWLTGAVEPVPNFRERFTLVVAVPVDRTLPVRAWAWWSCGVAVGPRHVYHDGSICAFEPEDAAKRFGDWRRGTSLVRLLDFISVWLTRHVYLREFGRWPGHQMLHTILERQLWNRPDEFCGCGASRPYAACHASADHAAGEVEIAREIGVAVDDLARIRRELVGRAPPRTLAAMRDAVLTRRISAGWQRAIANAARVGLLGHAAAPTATRNGVAARR